MANHLVFYDDAPNFGGHEMMTLQLLRQLVQQGPFHITFIVSVQNSELRRQLTQIVPAVSIHSTPYSSARGQWLRTWFSPGPLLRLRRLMRQLKPDLLVVVQGGIALSSLALVAGRLAGVRTVSYIPMTHDESMFAATPARAALRQWLVQPFYRLPDCLITISQRMAAHATRRRGGTVRVVENGIAVPRLDPNGRAAVRSALGLHDGDRLLLMIGRIEFWQKRHDLAVQAIAIARSRGVALHLLVVGSGPDEAALRAQVGASELDDRVHWRDWQADVSSFYAACDALLLPSRYEGVPLVMMEAMAVGRKVLASDIDGMADMLPPAWLFPSGDADALADLMCQPEGTVDAERLRRHRELIGTHYTIEAFGRRFLRVIDEELELSPA